MPARPGRPVFRQFNLVVKDVKKAALFYRRLGLKIGDGHPAWSADHVSAETTGDVDFDLDSIAFAKRWNRGWGRGGRASMGVLGFGVATRDEVDRIYAELTGAGYAGQQPPYDAFWGARYAVVEDPDGNAVGLMSPIDEAYRSESPEPPTKTNR